MIIYHTQLVRSCTVFGSEYTVDSVAGASCGRQSTHKGLYVEEFVKKLIKDGHDSVTEFVSILFNIRTDRATANELVRHRMASYCQESTRYVDYTKKDFSVVVPLHAIQGDRQEAYFPETWKEGEIDRNDIKPSFMSAVEQFSHIYNTARMHDMMSPEEARAFLPLCFETNLFVLMNVRSFRNFIKLRLNKAAHPEMRFLAQAMFHKAFERGLSTCFFDDVCGL